MNQRLIDLGRQEIWLAYKELYLILQSALLESYEKTKDQDFLKMVQETGDTYAKTKNDFFGHVV